ncbi:hypothetical protein DFJ74DRAFT_705969 [Hyaloraphidium curvatum]|nr:hypothetical protein DFJ74DRAFT_705969 [Hyaloraphidium curvatum]
MLFHELPAEALLHLIQTFLGPEDAFFLRLACSALRPVATAAFPSWVSRALLEERDARKAYDASTERFGYKVMSPEAMGGVVRAGGAADPECRVLIEMCWHVLRRPELR